MNNLSEYVAHWAGTSPDHEAVVFGQRRISYRDFDAAVNELAGSLDGLKLRRGDRVAVQMLSSPEYLALYMAAARAGLVLVGINAQYKAEEARHLLEVTRPRLLVSAGAFAAALDQATAAVRVEHRVLLDGQAPGWMSWKDFTARDGGTRSWKTAPDDPALIVFTSGTTGKPKGAVLTHRNVTSNIEVEVRHFGLTPRDRLVHHLPMNHVGGATEITMGAFVAGATLLLMERFHPQATLELVARERATFLGQVPAMFIMELNLPDFARFDLSSLTRLVVAGAATPSEVMKRMMGIAPVVTGYGMSEVAGFATYTAPEDDPETVARSVGRVAAEFELRVVGDKGADAPAGEIGEVLLRGPIVMKGYFGDEAATREAVDPAGWYRTGDMGLLDARGYLTLVGRKKDMYISGGYNVYPAEIEEAISRHPAVLLCAVVAAPDPVLGEVGKAYVVPRPGASLDDAGLNAFLSERLARYKIPSRYEVRDKLPMTPLGKVDKKLLG